MAGSNFSRRRTIPTKITTRKSAPTTTDFAKGINTYKPNDLMKLDELHLAQDGRFDRIGEYKTRKGLSGLSVPVGKTKVHDNTTGAYVMSPVDGTAYPVTLLSAPAANTVICSLSIKIRKLDDTYGVVRVDLLNSDQSAIIGTSCVSLADITAETDTEVELQFMQAPDAVQQFFVRPSLQLGSTASVEVATISDILMCKVNTATKGRITSIFEANLSDNTGSLTDKSILFTFAAAGDNSGNETLYRLSEEGNLFEFTTLKTDGRPVRYSQDASIIRCVYGNNLTALNPTTPGSWGWQVSTIPTNDLETGTDLDIKLSNILSGPEDNLLYFDAATTSQLIWTWPYGGQYVAPAS